MKITEKVYKKFYYNNLSDFSITDRCIARYLKNGFLLLKNKNSEYMILSTKPISMFDLSCYDFKNMIIVKVHSEEKYSYNSVWIKDEYYYNRFFINFLKELL